MSLVQKAKAGSSSSSTAALAYFFTYAKKWLVRANIACLISLYIALGDPLRAKKTISTRFFQLMSPSWIKHWADGTCYLEMNKRKIAPFLTEITRSYNES